MLLRPADEVQHHDERQPAVGRHFREKLAESLNTSGRGADCYEAEREITPHDQRAKTAVVAASFGDHEDADGLQQGASKALAYNDNSGELALARERGLVISAARGTGVGSEKRRSSRDGD